MRMHNGTLDSGHRNSHTNRDALPFCYLTLRWLRCEQGPYFRKHAGYPANPKTIGEAIRKRRLDLKLLQKEVARTIGCTTLTLVNWEKGHTVPSVHHMAGVVRFLGFNPLPNGDNLAQRLVNHRRALGVTQKSFARQIGVDPSTLARWERGERKLNPGRVPMLTLTGFSS